MNVFYLDNDPIRSAQMMTNKHIVKMIIESAQILSTAHRVLDGKMDNRLRDSGRHYKYWELPDAREKTLYKATHYNHPSSVWARSSLENYKWLYKHFCALCDEYTERYFKTHLTDMLLRDVLVIPPNNIISLGFSQPSQVMPIQYQNKDSVLAYNNYYIAEKLKNISDINRYNLTNRINMHVNESILAS